jgi:DNA modification methylase
MEMTIQIKPDERNANKGTARGRELLRKSLREYGAGRSILADRDGRLIAGNKTYEAAQELGLPVRVVEANGDELIVVKRNDLDLSERTGKARELAYADNRVAEIDLEWEAEQLAADLEAGIDLGELGFGERELKDILGDLYPEESDAPAPQIDRAEELLEKWQVQTGDLWEIGEHRLLCGDCTKRDDVKKLLNNEQADMVFTDPPYGVAIGDKNKFLNSFQKAGRNLENIAGDLMGKDELFDMLVNSFTLTREFMKDCCAIYVTAPQGGELGMMMMMMSGLPVRHVLNWVKNSPTFSMGRLDYEYQHEPILYSWKVTHKHYGNGKHQTSTWFIDKPRASKEHPTMKPVELVENALLNSSLEKQIIYEPFSGSGTTLVACERLGRKGRGMEIMPKYVAVALERLSEMGIEPRRVG